MCLSCPLRTRPTIVERWPASPFESAPTPSTLQRAFGTRPDPNDALSPSNVADSELRREAQSHTRSSTFAISCLRSGLKQIRLRRNHHNTIILHPVPPNPAVFKLTGCGILQLDKSALAVYDLDHGTCPTPIEGPLRYANTFAVFVLVFGTFILSCFCLYLPPVFGLSLVTENETRAKEILFSRRQRCLCIHILAAHCYKRLRCDLGMENKLPAGRAVRYLVQVST